MYNNLVRIYDVLTLNMYFDDDVVKSMIEKAETFFHHVVLPELLAKYFSRRQKANGKGN